VPPVVAALLLAVDATISSSLSTFGLVQIHKIEDAVKIKVEISIIPGTIVSDVIATLNAKTRKR
jgi:hypothetical protein